jgi:hypothetical protein
MRMMLVCLMVAACSKGGRADECKAFLDKSVPVQEANVRKAVEMVAPTERATIKEQGDAEIAAFKTKFVDLCIEHAGAPLSCLDDTGSPRSRDQQCKEKWKPVREKLYGNL